MSRGTALALCAGFSAAALLLPALVSWRIDRQLRRAYRASWGGWCA